MMASAHIELSPDGILRLRERLLAAESLNRRKDRFIATVVHELRQPLAPMAAALELMKLRVSRESGERARKIVEKQLAQLTRLIEDLMDAARINERKVNLRNDRADLRDLVKDAIQAVDPLVRAKRQTVDLTAPEVELWVNVDVTRVRQIFTNLMSNASKFSGAESQIRVRIGFEDANIKVQIQDQGQGIAPDALPHIFEIFRQSTDGQAGGLGVGLSVVRGLVELHGGTVEALSGGVGRGSTFTVRLPNAV